MPRGRSPAQSPPDIQSWVDDIPLGALGQSYQSRESPSRSSGLNLQNNASTLSETRHGSDRTGATVHRTGTPVGGTSLSPQSFSEPSRTPVDATTLSRSRSSQQSIAVAGQERRIAVASSTDDSLLQLETAGIPPEVHLSLPSSHSGSLRSTTTVTATQRCLDSLEQLSRLQPIDPSNVSLPPDAEQSVSQFCKSSHGSAFSVGSAHVFANSLEQLHLLHPADPPSVPLPESNSSVSITRTESSVRQSSSSSAQISTVDERDYWQKVEPLTRFMPHLKDIFPPKGRHRYAGKATCFDYLSDGSSRFGIEIDMSFVRSRSGREMMADRLKELKIVEDPTVSSRVILVEDLCSESIEILGSTFGLDPEMFAEHLNRSGYDGEDYGEADAERWNTSHLGKDFVAMTWCRPLYQNPLLTDWLRAPRKLLNEVEDSPDGMSSVTWRDPIFTIAGKRDRMAREHRLRVETNVFRRSWPLSAEAASLDSQRQATGRRLDRSLDELRPTLVPTAWQERATFCCVQGDANIPIVILLLDPLPTITDIRSPLYTRDIKEVRTGVIESSSGSLSQSTSTHAGAEVDVEIGLPMAPRISDQISLNKYRACDAQLGVLKDSFTDMRSTSWWIQNADDSSQAVQNSGLNDPIIVLLKIVENDTRIFLRSLEWVLDDICNDSLDEFILTRRLSDWRKLMNEFEKEVPAISERLEHFVHFIFGSNGNKMLPAQVNEVVQNVRKNVARVKTRLDEAYADLRVDMQFNESRRSMNETQTVTRCA